MKLPSVLYSQQPAEFKYSYCLFVLILSLQLQLEYDGKKSYLFTLEFTSWDFDKDNFPEDSDLLLRKLDAVGHAW
jgi:hypothetical protein